MRDTTKELIKQYMLGLISVNDAAVVAKTVENFGKSKSTVYNYLKELLDEGTVYKHENKNEYYLAFTQKDFSYANNGKLDEARVFASDIEPMLSDLPKNVFRIWQSSSSYFYPPFLNPREHHPCALSLFTSGSI